MGPSRERYGHRRKSGRKNYPKEHKRNSRGKRYIRMNYEMKPKHGSSYKSSYSKDGESITGLSGRRSSGYEGYDYDNEEPYYDDYYDAPQSDHPYYDTQAQYNSYKYQPDEPYYDEYADDYQYYGGDNYYDGGDYYNDEPYYNYY